MILTRFVTSVDEAAVVLAGGRGDTSCSASAVAGGPAVVSVEDGSVVAVVTFLSGEVFDRLAVVRSGDSSRSTL